MTGRRSRVGAVPAVRAVRSVQALTRGQRTLLVLMALLLGLLPLLGELPVVARAQTTAAAPLPLSVVDISPRIGRQMSTTLLGGATAAGPLARSRP